MRVGTLGAVKRSSKLLKTRDNTCPQCLHVIRTHSSKSSKAERPEENTRKVSRKDHERQLDREFFLSVFNTNATKRDAKAYISRYKEESAAKAKIGEVSGKEKNRTWRLKKTGVNLGGLYGQARAIEYSPVFTQGPLPEVSADGQAQPIHVAAVKIRGLQDLDQETLKGVALTLSQLARLGLLSCVAIEAPENGHENDWRKAVMKQCFRLANAINDQSKSGARVVDQALSVNNVRSDIPSTVPVQGKVDINMKDYLLGTLQHGLIPIIPPIAYTSDSRMQQVEVDEVMFALTRELAGLSAPVESIVKSTKPTTTLDKIIVLDPLGGLPAENTTDQSHIFVNLNQEYQYVRTELLQVSQSLADQQIESEDASGQLNLSENIEQSVVEEIRRLGQHVKNLDLIKGCLTLLPPSSSALLTTPSEAASSALFSPSNAFLDAPTPGVGTRAKRNPLIHNLLTDKPTVSSSLPMGRMLSPQEHIAQQSGTTIPTLATFFKRGMPLTIIPDPKITPWKAPGLEGSSLRLESDPNIDFPRLLHLIEDSFGRPLDAKHYLERIKGRIAGIIVAGEYEGGAILTWETPPQNADSQPRPAVPYLDKFAVLRRSQGSGGVADIVFNAMVRTCLPDGVVWRSRQNNPVNKWYFERSVGTWKLPGSQWCMFWTGADVDFGVGEGEMESEKRKRWDDFVGVCSGIEASWADRGTNPPD